jgi:cytochrome b561
MKRTSINFIVDLAGFLVFIALFFTGYVIRFTLPPGTGGKGREISGGVGRTDIEQFWSMSRYQWSDIHYILAAVFTILIIIHILMHFSWIKCYIRSTFSRYTKSAKMKS